MIQIIGVMIGTYIIVRMIQIIANKSESKVTQIFAGINLVITLFLIIGVLVSGVNIPKY